MQLPLPSADPISLSQLESHLWEAANILRGPVDAADFKTYIFPLLFFRRISDVYDEERACALEESEGDDKLMNEALGVLREYKRASVSLLQRRLSIGYTRAARLLDTLEERGIVGPSEDGRSRVVLESADDGSTAIVVDDDPDESDEFWVHATGFTAPSTVLRGVLGSVEPEVIRSSPAFFDAGGIDVQQHWAVSDDGTRVPYFQVAAGDLALDGSHPTLLSGYGGFQASRLPEYSGIVGRAWLDRGGVFVLANIRGGGEFGPGWHTSALKQNRPRAYEDFAAIARDLVARGVTTAARLACEGRSNGGLLVGNMLTTYPELFGAVVCGVPLLDMKRYTHLSAGASWIAEYGDPDVAEEWEYIRTFSPYQLLKDDTDYPPVLFYAATSDDRVGPVQARKMAARMQAMGIDNVLYYENSDGGHGGAVDNSHTARLQALIYEFLWKSLA